MANGGIPNNLAGVRVALLQGRRSGQFGDLVRRQGGLPISVEAVREVPLPCADEVSFALDALRDGSTKMVVFSTGAAASALIDEAGKLGRRQELIQSLTDVIAVCRGPKPAMVLRHEGIKPSITIPAPHTAASLLAAIAHLDLRDIGATLLHYGETNPYLADALRDRGANLTELCLYEWMLPDDITHLQSLVRDIIDGDIDAIAFTSQVQGRHLYAVAREMGVANDLTVALNNRVVVASLAPTCVAGLRRLGVEPHVVPELSRMGPLVLALGEHFARHPPLEPPGRQDRRQFVRTLAVVSGVLAASLSRAPAIVRAGSDSARITIGFISLTDCASLVMAKELGLFAERGLDVELVKQASWATTRDALLNEDIDAAHCLYSLPFSVNTGVGGRPGSELFIAMVLSNNGQAITLAGDTFGGRVGFRDLASVKSAIESTIEEREVTLAMTFPGGTHDIWMRYWLAAAGIDPMKLRIITTPPPQMVATMRVNSLDGFSVGEPWNGTAVRREVGFTHIASQDIWKHHPEKALVVSGRLAGERRDDLKGVMHAVLEASRYVDGPGNVDHVAETIGQPAYVNADPAVIVSRLAGNYDLGGGLGTFQYTDDAMHFFGDGMVNAPRRGHAIWFMTQFARFGYLDDLPDGEGIANRLILSDLYAEVAAEAGLATPNDDFSPFSITIDNAIFDPLRASSYLPQTGVTGD